jgi:hypothetical protein
MSSHHTGNIQPGLDLEEHDGANNAKRVTSPNLNIELSALRDAITAATPNNKTLKDLWDKLAPASSFDHGGNSDIDTTAEQITTTSMASSGGVLVRADDSNTGYLYLGNSDVTAGTDATQGIKLAAGESIFIPIDNANKIYAIGSAVNQALTFLVI